MKPPGPGTTSKFLSVLCFVLQKRSIKCDTAEYKHNLYRDVQPYWNAYIYS